MSESAHVTSIASVAQFKAALRVFEDDATRAIVAIDEQAKGALQWLEHDAPAYWRRQIRECMDELDRTRAALETCRRRATIGSRPACMEEENAFREAQRRLTVAQGKLEVVRRWAQRLRREIDEYRGRTMPCRTHLESHLPRTISLVERYLEALEAYAERSVPEAAQPAPAPDAAPAAEEKS